MELNPLNFGSTPGLPPKSGGSMPHSSASDLTVSSLQQHRDRAQASTSMNRVINKSQGSQAVSSINRIGQDSHVSTSISHPTSGDVQNFEDGVDRDAVRDRLRYQHVRQAIKQRKAEEALASAGTKKSVYNTGIDTSSPGFLRRGPKGYERHIFRMVKQNKSTYKNLSKTDQRHFLDVVEPHARATHVGFGFGRIARKQMKKQLRRDFKTGVISKEDMKDMRRMVDQLPKRKGFFGV